MKLPAATQSAAATRRAESGTSDEWQPTPYIIVVDSREQSPWTFLGLHQDAKDGGRKILPRIEVRALKTGDYSISGLESKLAIERKSLSDLFSTLGQRRKEFEAEHERMAEVVAGGSVACVIVEADMHNGLCQPPPESGLSSKVVLRTMISWQLKYNTPWVWAGSRRFAEIYAFRLMEKVWLRQQEKDLT